MAVQIRYFAWLRERMGRADESLSLPDGIATVGDLAAWLRERDAAGLRAFADLATVRAAVNQVFAPSASSLQDGDEVAFFPPVTGG